MAISLLNGRSYIPGMTYNPQGQSTGVMGQLTGQYTPSNYNPGMQTIRQTQQAMGYLNPGYHPPTTPVSGQMTWDQWAQNMQNQYGTGSSPLGGGNGNTGGTPSQPPVGYTGGYTGYGNSNLAASSNGSPANNSSNLTATGNPNYNGSVPAAPRDGTMSGLNGMVNQNYNPVTLGGSATNTPTVQPASVQIGLNPVSTNPQFSSANNSNPFGILNTR